MTDKDYLNYVSELLSLAEVSFRPMMGEYVLYCKGKVIGGCYDDRFLMKSTPSARELLPNAEYAVPYKGAKEMLVVDGEDKLFLKELCERVADDLPPPGKKR